jgi:hypothetical protein
MKLKAKQSQHITLFWLSLNRDFKVGFRDKFPVSPGTTFCTRVRGVEMSSYLEHTLAQFQCMLV